jgi:hypothetical protein
VLNSRQARLVPWSTPVLIECATRYAEFSRIQIDWQSPLGLGTDGAVWKSSRKTAVKALERERNYRIELECYQRLYDADVTRVCGFAVPKLIGFHDDFQIIEMDIVSPPFVLDFAKCWLDTPPEFSDKQWDDWQAAGQELFEARWQAVLELLAVLKQYGIYYYDAKPANIVFGEEAI